MADAFTDDLYRTCSQHLFVHIAHFNWPGFADVWFTTPDDKAAFIRHAMNAISHSDPAWTWSDVEQHLQRTLADHPHLQEPSAWTGATRPHPCPSCHCAPGPATDHRSLGQLTLEHGEQFVAEQRQRRRALRGQGSQSVLRPGFASTLYRPGADPQVVGDDCGLVALPEPLGRLQTATTRGRPAVCRPAPLPSPHADGIPQGV